MALGDNVHKCPTCGARANTPVGVDGSPRNTAPLRFPDPTPEQMKRKLRAWKLRQKNEGSKH